MPLNHRQRKFLSELADLMEKYNMQATKVIYSGELVDVQWTDGIKQFSQLGKMNPSSIRQFIERNKPQ